MSLDLSDNFQVDEDILDVLSEDVFAFPLSFAQQRLWFLDRLIPGSPLYNIPASVRIRGKLDIAALEKSLNEIVQRHESLRTTFASIEGQPMQIINPYLKWELPIVDLQHLPESDREAKVHNLVLAESQRPFDLTTGPLLRITLLQLAPLDYVLLITFHHIIADLWSLGVFFRELVVLYEAFLEGKESPLTDLPIQYADFAEWQQEQLQGEVLFSLLDYWKQQLSNVNPILQLPSDRPRPAVQNFRGAIYALEIPQSLFQPLKELNQQEGVTLFMTLLAAFQTLLYRYTGQDDILVGTPIANRHQAEIEGLIGFFVNTLVLRTKVSDNPSFRELLRRVREVTLGAYAHQDLPFEKLVEALQLERNLSQNPLVQVMFVMQNAPIPTINSNLILEPIDIDTGTAKFDLTLIVDERQDIISIAFEYNTDLFDETTIARIAGHFQNLLAEIGANSNKKISELSLLTAAEQQQLKEWNQTEIDYPKDICLHQLFEAQVGKTPESIAVLFAGQTLTYQQLDRRAEQLANYLVNLGVKSEVLVGICIERSLEMVIGLLGILKAGGAYVPLDPTMPQERLSFMLQDTGVKVLLTQSHLVEKLPKHRAKVICLDKNWEDSYSLEKEQLNRTQVTPDNLAYVIYTSGSTGKPKGVMNTHRGICNRLLWMQDAYQLTSSDRVLQKTPFSFDVSVWEFFWTLSNGATLVIAKPEGHKDSNYLAKLIESDRITTMHFVPSMLQAFLKEPELEKNCHSLRQVFCSGEALPKEAQDRFFERIKAELHNLYGPTEAAVDVTYWACQRGYQHHTVPIGRPIANTQMYILDANLQQVPVGIIGELYIGGVNVARGYLNRADLTAERFVVNPFDRDGRLYKTGDLARYLPDGNIDYLGRIDYQVKLRGNRIELGEIETVLIKHPDVQDAVAIAREDVPGQQQLVAYVISNLLPERIPIETKCLVELPNKSVIELTTQDISPGGVCLLGVPNNCHQGQHISVCIHLPGTDAEQWLEGSIAWHQANKAGVKFDLTPTEKHLLQQSFEYLMDTQGFLKVIERTVTKSLRSFLKQKLPDYMLPDRFVILSSFPLSANGKLDRKALPLPDQSRPELEKAFVAANTSLQAEMVNIWAKILRLEKVGISDNFFELGGNSLLAAQAIANFRETLQVDLPVRCIFEHPTIEGLSQIIETVQREGNSQLKTAINLQAEAVLDPEIYPKETSIKFSQPHHILLTGATGFLGAFLLDELLKQTQANIYCLVRAANDSEGINRLQKTLEQYALWNPSFSDRIIPILGDLAQPKLGLSDEKFARLSDQIDTIYHCGADVNFVKPYSVLKAGNVLGTQEILRLACQGKVKPVHYISTLSIFGTTSHPDNIIREDDNIDGYANNLYMGYSQSKWVAEKLVAIAKSRGLPVTIFRAGTIGGDSQTGATNTNDYASRLVKGCIQIGSFPTGQENDESAVITVDYASKTIVYLSTQPGSLGKAFHLVSPHHISSNEFFNLIREYGYQLKQLPYEQWKHELIEQAKTSQDNALYPVLSLHTEKVSEAELSLPELSEKSPSFDYHNTREGLADTSISCPPVDAKLVNTYLGYFISSGFIKPPSEDVC